MATRKYPVEFTFAELAGLAQLVKERFDGYDYTVKQEFGDEPSSWSVRDAEEALVKRARLSAYHELLTGEALAENPEWALNVQAARTRFDIVEAKKEEED